ncbi:hypothetical protein AC579_2189 [Pseudocercospora musae]|uniref:Uncharacterized protein n=1 Tax=Pseudocercospora musae TaxID=113226 RepID=A0A139IL85_9PEZI|nr:hypothetical protein AC579_2189 [Pseudocercospora musae]
MSQDPFAVCSIRHGHVTYSVDIVTYSVDILALKKFRDLIEKFLVVDQFGSDTRHTWIDQTVADSPFNLALYHGRRGDLAQTPDQCPPPKLARNQRPRGAVYFPVTHMHVNWAWFIYPAGLTVIVAATMIVFILGTDPGASPVWKE